MKKSLICLLALIISIFISLFLVSFVSAININEVELNPAGSDSGFEWIELYSSNEIDLNGWKIMNNDNQSLELNQSFNGYFIINLKGQWLDNSNEKVFLYNGNNLISETILLSDSNNDNKAWQYCNGNWNFITQTKGSINSCSSGNPQNNTNQNNTNQNNTNDDEDSISLSIDWNEDDIVNGDEFDIEVSVENLEDKEYDVKIWIEDDGTVISDRYDEENDEWKSGTYYIDNFFQGPGDKSDEIKLKIRDAYSDFSGDAKIYFRTREGDETSDDIEILEKEEDEETNNEENTEKSNVSKNTGVSAKSNPPISSSSVTGNAIKLGNLESIEETKNENKESSVIYESKNGKIKIYAIVGFAVLCLGLVILILFKKIK